MADSTTNLDTISQSQSQKEVTANALHDAGSPAKIFGRRASTCSALVFGYYGGRFNGTSVPNGTVTATASDTNYVVVHRSTLAVTVATSNTNWNNTATYGRMYKLTADGSSITSYEDHRAAIDGTGIFSSASAVTPTGTGYRHVTSGAEDGATVHANRYPVVTSPTYASSLTIDMRNGDVAKVNIAGNITLDFSNGNDGQIIRVILYNTNGATFALGSGTVASSGIPAPAALSSGAGAIDTFVFMYSSDKGKTLLCAYNQGF